MSGIVVAGYIGADIIKTLTALPEPHGLVSILSISEALGGAVDNCSLDLARLDRKCIIKPLAILGDDHYGNFIRENLAKEPNIDLSLIIKGNSTGYTDVLDDVNTKIRSFLVYRGDNAKLDVDMIDVDKLDCEVFHIGYICLLDSLDSPDSEYGTRMARLLDKVQRAGILTSVDAVTDSTGRHKTLMPAAMKYADIMCVNEHEAGAAFDIPLRDENENLIEENIPKTLRMFREHGCRKWAVIHAPECAWGIDEQGEIIKVKGAKLPKGFIKGTVGAGDAFVSGLLLGARAGMKLRDAMEDGIAASVCSLMGASASETVIPIEDARKILAAQERGE